ncbi:hypothetical protein THAOC_15890, partial [Thalassiosira oceanica]
PNFSPDATSPERSEDHGPKRRNPRNRAVRLGSTEMEFFDIVLAGNQFWPLKWASSDVISGSETSAGRARAMIHKFAVAPARLIDNGGRAMGAAIDRATRGGHGGARLSLDYHRFCAVVLTEHDRLTTISYFEGVGIGGVIGVHDEATATGGLGNNLELSGGGLAPTECEIPQPNIKPEDIHIYDR